MPRESLWIFGYGSLVWRPDFPFAERHSAYLRDWSRRFWQGSTDHRGTPEAPGRVVTLVNAPGATCWGSVYRVAKSDRDAVLDELDHRERGGFERSEVTVHLAGTRADPVEALTYVATPRNRNYLGPAPLADMADQIRQCHGPSGPNVEYLLRLAESLLEMGADDEHVFALVERVRSAEGR